GTGDGVRMPGFLVGPVVRRNTDGSWAASWFCEDKVQRLTGTAAELAIDCGGKRQVFPVSRTPTVPNSVFDTTADTLILSDIEGNVRFLDAALASLAVTDAEGKWRYGRNHLVIAGDAVDRGRDVFAVLWRLYALSLQAQDAGGAVHLVLGNHEQYLLRGNTSRANRDHLYALTSLGGQAQAFGPDTLIGRWLRLQPVIIKSGRVVITHGGVSPMVANSGFTVSVLNSAMRRYWSGDMPGKAELDSVIGPAGVTQYRGYFQDGEDSYPLATDGQLGEVLAHFGAKTIVVGHTLVDGVTALHDGKVWAVDVNSNTARPEALLVRNGEPRVVTTGVARQLDEGSGRRVIRPFSLFASGDVAMLKGLLMSNYALSRIPQPY
ncbi:MAG: metallophosphoesterase, partial [Telluria sp.]